jgi:hypothetical protein
MGRTMKYLGLAAVAALIAGQAQATTFDVSLTGQVSNFSEAQFNFDGLHFDQFSLPLSGLDGTDAITVSQGDMINATVTLDMPYTIPASMVRTDFLLFLTGSSFPSENTGVNGTFSFFDGGAPGPTFGYGSTTSNQLSSFAAIFPPNNTPITFDSFTDDFTINSLPTSATLDGSSLTYDLVSNVPEPGAWAMMLVGFGGLGMAMRSRRRQVAATA